MYVTAWYPHKFGNHIHGDETARSDPYRFTSIIRQILPTRTGLDSVKSTAAVWLSAVNSTALPGLQEKAVRVPWTETDHWEHYKGEGTTVERIHEVLRAKGIEPSKPVDFSQSYHPNDKHSTAATGAATGAATATVAGAGAGAGVKPDHHHHHQKH